MDYINLMLKLARKAFKKNEIPVAALIIHNQKIVAQAINSRQLKNDVLGHAEISCIKKASRRLKRWNLADCVMITTLKPCHLCQSIITASRIKKVYYLLDKPVEKKEYDKTTYEQLEVINSVEDEYKLMLRKFFENKRKK